MRTTWNFSSAGRLLFGRGAVDELGPAVRRFSVERILVITDEPLVAAGAVDRVRSALLRSGLSVEVFTGGEPEPTLDAASGAIAHARQFGPDAILGLGGGSNIDLAKMTAIVHTHGGEARDYFGWDNVPGPTCPMIAVATTAGTGSEVSASAVLTDAANEVKVSTLSPHIRPALGVVDPLLTLTCPPKPTADSGIDALTHAIEAYLATHSTDLPVPPGELGPYEGKNPMADLVAERAITLIGQHLETAVAQPDNLEAREAMALAATLGGMAFSNAGVALVHAMEYPLGGRLHCSHGAGNGLLLPYVMRFNLPAREAEIARIAELLGEDVRGCSQQDAAERGIAAVERLRAAIGIPTRIREFGGTADQLPDLAAKTFGIKRLLAMTPREPTEADILAIFQEAL